jgi:hypothetical protein
VRRFVTCASFQKEEENKQKQAPKGAKKEK